MGPKSGQLKQTSLQSARVPMGQNVIDHPRRHYKQHLPYLEAPCSLWSSQLPDCMKTWHHRQNLPYLEPLGTCWRLQPINLDPSGHATTALSHASLTYALPHALPHAVPRALPLVLPHALPHVLPHAECGHCGVTYRRLSAHH